MCVRACVCECVCECVCVNVSMHLCTRGREGERGRGEREREIILYIVSSNGVVNTIIFKLHMYLLKLFKTVKHGHVFCCTCLVHVGLV